MRRRNLYSISFTWKKIKRCMLFSPIFLWALVVFIILYKISNEPKQQNNNSEHLKRSSTNDPDVDWVYEYWKRGPQLETLRLKLDYKPINDQRNLKFVTFESDIAGFNNVRMAFEAVCIAARLTNRVLVLPPPVQINLLDYGPIKLFSKSAAAPETQMSRYSDFFDMSAMEKGGLRVITTEEFIKVHLKNEAIPEDAMEHALRIISKNIFHSPWFLYLRDRPDTTIWPSGPVSTGDFSLDDVTRLDQIASDKRIIHFAVDVTKKWRYLGGVPRLVKNAPLDVIQFAKVFTRNHIIYNAEIQYRSKLAVESSFLKGPGQFACLHIRRNDLPYKKSLMNASHSLDNIQMLLKPNETLYIATDETAEGFFDIFIDRGFRVVRLSDVLPIVLQPAKEFIRKYDGMLEQLICSKSRIFFGTSASTFSVYIHRLRMYAWSDFFRSETSLSLKQEQKNGLDQKVLDGIDLRCHFHDRPVNPWKERQAGHTGRLERSNCGDVGFANQDGMFFP